MSRSGYTDDWCGDNWDFIRGRGAVNSAMRGRRGQAFLKEMLVHMDAMPEKRLIKEELVTPQGEVCAMGVVAKARGIDVSKVDPTDKETVANLLDIAVSMVAEIAYLNDEGDSWNAESPQDRFQRIRKWIVTKIKE